MRIQQKYPLRSLNHMSLYNEILSKTQFCIRHIPSYISFPIFYQILLKKIKHRAKSKEFYGEHLYTYYLDFTTTFYYTCFWISVHLAADFKAKSNWESIVHVVHIITFLQILSSKVYLILNLRKAKSLV